MSRQCEVGCIMSWLSFLEHSIYLHKGSMEGAIGVELPVRLL